jgi:hypothetical protein
MLYLVHLRDGRSEIYRWQFGQERFVRTGVAGLLCDKTRPPRIPPLPASVRERRDDGQSG